MELNLTKFRELVCYEPDIKVRGEASNGRDAIKQFNALMPDVMTIDINMPVLDGIAATKESRIMAWSLPCRCA